MKQNLFLGRHFLRRQRYLIPRSFWVRAMVLLVVPVVVIQVISGYVFFKHHLQTTAQESARAIAGNIALATQLWETNTLNLSSKEIERRLLQNLHLSIISNVFRLHKRAGSYYFQHYLDRALEEQLKVPYWVHMRKRTTMVGVLFEKKTLLFSFPTRLFFARSKSTLWFLWSFGSAFFFCLIALFFMRQQIRPLQNLTRLARAVEKGESFKPIRARGPLEVRQVTKTLQSTYSKLQGKHEEHMRMLAALSHDLRTPLTRLQLQLALMSPSKEVKGLKFDVQQMIQMVDSYLTFLKKGEPEIPERLNIHSFCRDFCHKQPTSPKLCLNASKDLPATALLPLITLERCLQNIYDNAARHGRKKLELEVVCKNKTLIFALHDDGPGVDPKDYPKLSEPFTRLDNSRNLEKGGVGLGLTIVQTLLQSSNGKITFSPSPLGGLCVSLVFSNFQ